MKRLLLQLLALFPSRLPTGVSEFNTWAESFAQTYNLPTSNVDSIKFTLASVIMHLGSTSAYKSKFYFYLVMNSAASKQVAGQVFYDIKTAQAEAAKKALEDSNVQATGS